MDAALLREQLENASGLSGLLAALQVSHPHLFSNTAVFVPRAAAQAMQEAVSAIERVIALPEYQKLALSRAPLLARPAFGPRGVFTSYDFHLAASGPHLIEINTNAGGALLNAALSRAQRACCGAMDDVQDGGPGYGLSDSDVVELFRAEWRLQRGSTDLTRIAIVDDEPVTQHLAPEFELFRKLFVRNGIDAFIADPRELVTQRGHLVHEGATVDLIYNRLTDFQLTDPRHQVLKEAYTSGSVVLTPHPHAHALYADKRNLIALSDSAGLESWGVSRQDRELLCAIVPHTELLTPSSTEHLWAQRRAKFFKPFGGYGARAAYRGDKLTRRVWDEIKDGGFIAQDLVPPTERLIGIEGITSLLKFDLRAYTYAGQIQLLAARLYRGQTTNMRTPGGGFAPVLLTRD
ncbi:MAG: hypothetical protein ABI645_00855 [Pseudomonadota bacterium]